MEVWIYFLKDIVKGDVGSKATSEEMDLSS
jgi:hypothetical protein